MGVAMEQLPYSSGDPAALGPDERVRFECEFTPQIRLRDWARRAAVVTGLGIAFVILAWAGLPAGTWIGVAGVLFAVGVAAGLLVLRDIWTRRNAPTNTRLTTERLLQRGPAGDRQLPLEALTTCVVHVDEQGLASIRVGGVPIRGDADDGDDALIGGDEVTIERGATKPTVEAIREALAAGARLRAERRARRRAWRPAGAEGKSMDVPLGDPDTLRDLLAAPLDGEVALWAGRPLISRPVFIRQRLRGLRAAAIWAILAAAATTAPFFVDWGGRARFGPGAVIAAVIGALILFGIFMGQVVEPIRSWRRLRQTRYVLTDRRAITRVGDGRQMQETSEFFDDADAATLTTDPDRDGVGTVAIGFSIRFESVADASALHALAVRAVAGARNGVAEAIALPEPPDAV